MTGWALLMSPKGRNASRDGFVKFVVADVCLNSPVISEPTICLAYDFCFCTFFKDYPALSCQNFLDVCSILICLYNFQ